MIKSELLLNYELIFFFFFNTQASVSLSAVSHKLNKQVLLFELVTVLHSVPLVELKQKHLKKTFAVSVLKVRGSVWFLVKSWSMWISKNCRFFYQSFVLLNHCCAIEFNYRSMKIRSWHYNICHQTLLTNLQMLKSLLGTWWKQKCYCLVQK